MKYIFMAGAPGSKWSSVAKNIYYSPDIDRSDYHDDRTYYHDASGQRDLMHLGAYWDPGMEFGKFFNQLPRYSKAECEAEFDKPFDKNSTGIRIVKSHVFANHIDYIKQTWPESPIVMVHRSADACLGWWVKCGHFDITYPDYSEYYQNLREMAQIITQQNTGIEQAIWDHKPDIASPTNNYELCAALKLTQPPPEYRQNYASSDITVKVIL